MNGREEREGSRVTIDRMNGLYLVSRQHPDPTKLRQRLDKVMRDQLAPACGRFLAQALDPGDPSVWLIRRLDVDLALDVGAVDDAALARIWARQIATATVRAMAYGADGDTVLHFPDQAAYLAQFVADLAEGQAWGKWYYRAFDSLRSLPTGTAMSEALIRDPALTEAVLRQLAERGRLERLLGTLSERDAQRVYAACCAAQASAAPASGGGRRRSIETLLAAWPTALPRPLPARVATAHNKLRLYLAVRAGSPALPAGDELRTAIDHLLALATVLQQMAAPTALIASLATGDLHRAASLARQAGLSGYLKNLRFFQQVASGDGKWLARVARTIAKPSSSPPPRGGRGGVRLPAAQKLATRFGGIFLLLPSLLELGLPELTEPILRSKLDGVERAQAARYLVAVKCFGRARAREAAHDPVLNLAVGLDGPPPAEATSASSRSTAAALDQAGQARLVERLARLGRLEGRRLSAELVAAPSSGKAVLLVRDVAHDAWVYTAPAGADGDEAQAALDRGLAVVRAAVETPLEALLLGPEIGGRLDLDALARGGTRFTWLARAQLPGLAPLHVGRSSDGEPLTLWTAEPEGIPGAMQEALARYLARARPAAQELAYLSLADHDLALVADLRSDLTWSLVANAVLKGLARRLLGFHWSSAEYLYQNFLGGTGLVQIEDHHIEVQLPSCPLQVVLRIAGVNGQTYTVPWLDEAEVRLSLESG
jgi:hypothetical protein